LDVYNANLDSIDLVILDLTMPVMSGSMVLEKIKELNPDVKVILSSSQSNKKYRNTLKRRDIFQSLMV